MEVMIEVKELSRSFDDIKAVDNLSFSVRRGELLGFLGPNGAGKSTTMKMLTCFLTPSSGTASVSGFDIIDNPDEVRSVVGYLPENAPLYAEMRVRDFLSFIAEVRGLEGSKAREAIDKVVEETSLEKVLNQRIETLSKGFKRRVGLAQAIIHDPEVLILDEPTDGLDPNQKHEVRNLIKSMSKDKCIVLSTHILEEVDALCTRAIIIANGTLLADGTPEELKKKSSRHGAIILSVGEESREKAKSDLIGQPFILEVIDSGFDALAIVPKGDKAEALRSTLNHLHSNNIAVKQFNFDGGQLDEVFRQITSGSFK